MKKFYDTVVDQATGIPRQGATVDVFDGAGAAVQLYSDDGITPIENPINRVTTDVNGLFYFYVANGTYTLKIQYAGATPVTITGVQIIQDVQVINALGNSTVNPASQKAVTDSIGALVVDSLGTSPTTAPSQNAFNQTTAAAGIMASDGNTVQTNLDHGGYVTRAETGAVARTAKAKAAEIFSVKDFGAVGDDSTDDTAAIQAAINAAAAVSGKVFFPASASAYKITDALAMDTASGSKSLILYGDGNSTIHQTGAGKDAIQFTTTILMTGGGLRDLNVICDATAGHCINVVHGITNCFITNCNLTQNNPAKSVLYGDFTAAGTGTGIYTCRFTGGVWTLASTAGAATATVAGVRVISNGQRFAGNVFENITPYYAGGEQFFKITTVTTGSIWLEDNHFRGMTFERCPGGGWYFDSAYNWTIEHATFNDVTDPYSNNLIEMASGVGSESQSNFISRVRRLGTTMASGKSDIKITAGQDTELRSVGISSGNSPKYDFGSKRVVVYGRIVGTISNDTSTVYFGNSTGQIKFPGASAYLSNYDEGTFTATLTGDNTAPTTPVTATARWTRIGRIMTVGVVFSSVDTTGAAGAVTINGLPVAVNSSNDAVSAVHMVGMGSVTAIAKAAAGGNSIILYRGTSATKIAHADGTAGPGKTIALTMTYTV